MVKLRKLDEYKRKRQFDRTPEPPGVKSSAKTENTFVIQKHAARRLHYDFRLAIQGTLKSWAVPKGPSLNPNDKRLAVQTEDHPLDYANFEGNIPEGSYGAGTVMVWDRGTFQVEGTVDAVKQLERGEIKFALNGEKLRGSFVIAEVQIETELFSGQSESATFELDGKRFRLSNLNKLYFPESGYTKRDLLAYYYRMANHVLPFLKDRPLVLRRYPDGIKGQTFFQKDLREGLPDWFKTVPVDSETRGEQIHYAIANDRASLLYLTGLGCIDHNPWSSRCDDLEHPDYFFFDLDPSEGTEFSVVVKIAKAVYEKLEELQLSVFLKTSGATGMHLYLPVEPVYTYEQLRTFAESVARMVTAEHAGLVTNERSVAKRPAGRVLIDVQ